MRMSLYDLLKKPITDPLMLSFVALAGALVLYLAGVTIQLPYTVTAIVLIQLVLLVLPVSDALARTLEDQYPRAELPAHVDGILILSGGFETGVFASRRATSDNGSLLRIVAGAELARRFPDAKLVFAGTSGGPTERRTIESAALAQFLEGLGVEPGRTLFERVSFTTVENIQNTLALVKPREHEAWVLVTSALHMPRAMGVAHKLRWRPLAWPSHYEAPAAGTPRAGVIYPAQRFVAIDRALHEWLGIASYRLNGSI